MSGSSLMSTISSFTNIELFKKSKTSYDLNRKGPNRLLNEYRYNFVVLLQHLNKNYLTDIVYLKFDKIECDIQLVTNFYDIKTEI